MLMGGIFERQWCWSIAGVLLAVENAVKVEPVGEFELKGIRRPLAAYNVVAAAT